MPALRKIHEGAPSKLCLGGGFLRVTARLKKLALREVENITSLLPLQCNSIKVKIPAQAELGRGTLESWDERRNPFATSC
jgi:hypothetical protein